MENDTFILVRVGNKTFAISADGKKISPKSEDVKKVVNFIRKNA